MDISVIDALLKDHLEFTTKSLTLSLCISDNTGCAPQKVDVTSWLNRSDVDPNNEKERHLKINKKKKCAGGPILEVSGLSIWLLFYSLLWV